MHLQKNFKNTCPANYQMHDDSHYSYYDESDPSSEDTINKQQSYFSYTQQPNYHHQTNKQNYRHSFIRKNHGEINTNLSFTKIPKNTQYDYSPHYEQNHTKNKSLRPSTKIGHQYRQPYQKLENNGDLTIQYKDNNPRKKQRKNSICSYNNDNSSTMGGVTDRLNEIETIMGTQNQNLRQQNAYLMKMIHKLQKNEQKLKYRLKKQKQCVRELTYQNNNLKQQYQKAKQFLAQNIAKVQKMVEMQAQHHQTSDTSSSFNQPPYFNNFQQYLPQKIENQPKIQAITKQKQRKIVQNKDNILEQLSDKFDAIMFEYRKTKDPSLRRKCIQIAKQIKQQKNKQNSYCLKKVK